jgi:hypothetical protein
MGMTKHYPVVGVDLRKEAGEVIERATLDREMSKDGN